MRRPILQDVDPGDGTGPDLEEYYDQLERYEDEQRDDLWEQEQEEKNEE